MIYLSDKQRLEYKFVDFLTKILFIMSSLAFASALFLIAVLFNRPTEGADSRIVNGTTAVSGQYPYQVSLRTLANNHFCGGSIIKTRWILTAAHCVSGSPAFKIVVGTNTLSTGGSDYNVTLTKIHPLYNPTRIIYDVAVVKTTLAIANTSVVNPIALANVLPAAGSDAVVSGWGLTIYPSNVLPNQLQGLNTTYISKLDCQTRIGGIIHFTSICAFRQQAGVCLGDSGGALAVNNMQIGIVSWVFPCAKGYPDAYTNVPYFLRWINTYTP